MEITKVFKACVKAAKAKGHNKTTDILPRKKTTQGKNSFHSRSLSLASNITKLRDFLLKHQTEYIGEFSHLISISCKMSEEERDEIDEDAQIFIKSCSNSIASLRSEVIGISKLSEHKKHCSAVVELLELYLKDVCKLYSKQRAYRVKQTVDRKRMSRLRPEKKRTDPMKTDGNLKNDTIKSGKDIKEKYSVTDKNDKLSKTTEKNMSESSHLLLEERKPKEEFLFTAEETQMFEEENERLYEEMNNVVKEIKNIEGKVIEIGQLQEIFQEKILSQSTQIEQIHETAVATTENVKEGNEQIREAIKNSATFRVWILFFLVMSTFSLLFLDWYNI